MTEPPRITETPDPSASHSDEELSALIDGELSPSREQALRARLAAEPALAARLAALEQVDVALRALPLAQPSPDLAARLRERLSQEQVLERGESRRALRSRLPVWGGAALAAAAAAYFLVTPGSLQPAPGSLGSEPDFAEASDEEIGIALDYDTLAELEIIEELELLEWMADLDAEAADGRKEQG